MKKITLSNGQDIPSLGLGTWKSQPNEVYEAIKTAVKIGYRHIDCAAIYGNESEIGDALSDLIKEGVVAREDLWITSKLWNDAHLPNDVKPALQKTISDLKLDYLDLYLIHWPVAQKPGHKMPGTADDFLSLDEAPIAATWKAMEEVHQSGLARSIGVSNFGMQNLSDLLETCTVKPVMNQVECHPYLNQEKLASFCHDKGIYLTAYSPLGSKDRHESIKGINEPMMMEDDTVKAIAQDKNVTPAQILLAWSMYRNNAVIPKSVNPGRLQQNFDSQNVELSSVDMDKLYSINKDRRYIDGSFWVKENGPYSLEDVWR